MSAIWAAVVACNKEGFSTSGSPPVEIASVPPELPRADVSVPTQPQKSAAKNSRVYLTAAMSNPRRESAERARALRRVRRLQSIPSPLHLRARARHRPSPARPRRDRELAPAVSAALPEVAATRSQRQPTRQDPGATIDHHRRGSSRVATASRSLAIVRCPPVLPHVRRARLHLASRSTAGCSVTARAARATQRRPELPAASNPFAG